MMIMVDLTVASIDAIHDELKRREMVEKDVKIKELFFEIDRAYSSGKISAINRETDNRGTSVSVTKYHVFLK